MSRGVGKNRVVRECLLQGRGGVSPDALPPCPRWGILWMGEVGGLG